MSDPSGQKLYVNLSASETRRRLKGYGHGVRKVQSGGVGKAIVIHTASGSHLAELTAKFADVGCSEEDPTIVRPVSNLSPAEQEPGVDG